MLAEASQKENRIRQLEKAEKKAEKAAYDREYRRKHLRLVIPRIPPRDFLERIGKPAEIPMRHRSPHFSHVFSGDHYAAGYYSYLWSEVLDADAFAAFEETGDIFNPEVARRLYQHVLSSGGSRDPAELYTAFRGRLPDAQALLKKRGFTGEAA